MNIAGLFQSFAWKAEELFLNVGRAVSAGKLPPPSKIPATLADPGPSYYINIDPLVRAVQVDSIIKGLAHSAFLALLLKRGGGVVPTE